MSRREYSATGTASRNGPCLRVLPALALASVAAAGCDVDGASAVPADGEHASSGEFAVPPFIASSRAVEAGRLSVTLSVGVNEDIPVDQSGGVYTATFDLPEGSEQSFPVEIVWSYDASGRGQADSRIIPIARASRALTLDSPRAVRVAGDGYVTDGFDVDGDGRNNFVEIDEGTDPLVADADAIPVAPNDDQGDCRETVLPGERSEDFEAPRDLLRFGARGFDETRALELDGERLVYHATVFVETPGTVTFNHVQGLPTNTNAMIYDSRPSDGTGTDERTVLAFANQPNSPLDGVPARLTVRLADPGLYCYALFDEPGADFADGAPLTDVVLEIAFSPDGS